jgi:transcriptional regulator with XRE-family HTH domain
MIEVPEISDLRELHRTWGRRIRQARLAAGLDQAELARRLGVGQQLISRWECGYFAPRDHLRPVVASELGCAVEDLFTYEPVDKAAA